MALSSKQIAVSLELQPHPEGGYYKETFRDASVTLTKSILPPEYKVDRPLSTAIYFLLPSGNVALLHRIPCAETFHFYLGEPLTVFELDPNGGITQTILGPDLAAGQKLQYSVPPFVWFGSYPTKDIESYSSDGSLLVKAPPRDPEMHYSLVGVTCAPAFQFQDCELASRSELLSINSIAKPFIEYLTSDD
ncbi:hypothetical protein SUGI_0656570 [Cryptomeria japonica]|uniref:uncharacterized protein LOC131043654 n=1 Tax=Cryptomeria japonica TaxID=3369 RepID=UPI0024147600|nr:uncharacterized protein LOC131043654 [Cryptomeria japonica]GLJ32638.1 hypothetical protein SUGI_0656570 [Cryptomeria japonica]